MSDARWFEIDTAIASAVRHFAGAALIFAKLMAEQVAEEKYVAEIGFMHAMQAWLDRPGSSAVTYPRTLR